MIAEARVLGTAVVLAAVIVATDAAIHGGAAAAFVAGGMVCALAGIAALVTAATGRLAAHMLPAALRPWPIPLAVVASVAASVAATVTVAVWLAARHRDPAMIGVTVAAFAAAIVPVCIFVLVPPCTLLLRWISARTWAGLAPRIAWGLVVAWASAAVVLLAFGTAPTMRGPLASRALAAWVALTDPDGDGHGLGGTVGPAARR